MEKIDLYGFTNGKVVDAYDRRINYIDLCTYVDDNLNFIVIMQDLYKTPLNIKNDFVHNIIINSKNYIEALDNLAKDKNIKDFQNTYYQNIYTLEILKKNYRYLYDVIKTQYIDLHILPDSVQKFSGNYDYNSNSEPIRFLVANERRLAYDTKYKRVITYMTRKEFVEHILGHTLSSKCIMELANRFNITEEEINSTCKGDFKHNITKVMNFRNYEEEERQRRLEELKENEELARKEYEQRRLEDKTNEEKRQIIIDSIRDNHNFKNYSELMHYLENEYSDIKKMNFSGKQYISLHNSPWIDIRKLL